MDLASGQVGPEMNWEVDLADGKVLLKSKYQGTQGGAEFSANLDVAFLLDELAKKIPGQFDDAVLGLLKAALQAV